MLLLHLLAVVVLTVFTQTGGLLYVLIWLLPSRWFLQRAMSPGLQKVVLFVLLYCVTALWLLPAIAPVFGRKPLPHSDQLQAHHWYIPLLNRHYVKPRLYEALEGVTEEQEMTTYYLDAGFPFWDWFLLFPHLSHGDGNQVDIAFHYRNLAGEQVRAPGMSGYGYYDAPVGREVDYVAICEGKGYWQYAIKAGWEPEPTGEIKTDARSTAALISALSRQKATRKIFLEPHLKARWGLASNAKVRFHGCLASRHDDHFHLMVAE